MYMYMMYIGWGGGRVNPKSSTYIFKIYSNLQGLEEKAFLDNIVHNNKYYYHIF